MTQGEKIQVHRALSDNDEGGHIADAIQFSTSTTSSRERAYAQRLRHSVSNECPEPRL